MDMDDMTGIDVYTFVWRIENFSYCFPRTGDQLKSPIFNCSECHFMQWTLGLYPRGRRKADRIDFRLHREDDCDLELTIEIEFALLNASGLPAHKTQPNVGVYPVGAETTFSVPRDEVERRSSVYLPGDVLTLQVRMRPKDAYGDRLCIFATTVIRVERWTFPLSVEGFSAFEKDTEFAINVDYAVKDCPSFRFRVCPDKQGDKYVRIKIHPLSYDRDCLVRCRVSLLGSNLAVVEGLEDETWFHRYRVRQPWTFPPFILKDKLQKNKLNLLPGDVLTLKIEFSVSLGEWKTNIKPKGAPTTDSITVQTDPVPPGPLQSDLKSLYRDKILCDFTLKVDSQTFPVHKSLLAARSRVFKTMFQKGWVDDTLTLRDTDPVTLNRFLNFAYGEELEETDWQSSVKLYSFADKYHLVSLRDVCKARLTASMNASNSWDLLLLSNKHQDEDLRKTAQNYILEREKSLEIALEVEGKGLHEVFVQLTNIRVPRRIL